MAQAAAPTPFAPPLAQPIPPAQRDGLREIAPWAVLAGLVLLLAMYFVSTEQGAVALLDGTGVHEFVHDARHLLGFPCH